MFFYLFLGLNVMAQDVFDEPIFSPVADKISPYPPSSILYKQYLESGNYYFNQGLYHEAKQLFWKAIHLYPQNPDAYINLGTVHIDQDDPETALRILKKAETLSSPGYLQAEILFYNLGLANFLEEEYSPAIVYFKKALAEFADFAQAKYYLALSYQLSGQHQKADEFRKIESEPFRFLEKIETKPIKPIDSHSSVSGNAGNLNKGYFTVSSSP